MGQGPTALAAGADRGCLDVFAPVYHFSSFSFSGKRPDIYRNTVSRTVRPKTTSLATFLTTQNAMLEYQKQKLHDSEKIKPITCACKNQSK